MTTGPNPESQAPNPRTLALLIEIGCEEIPARFLSDAQKSFGERLRAALEERRLLPPYPHSVQSYSTPRRLVVHVHEVLESQRDTVEEVIGPPVKVAFDKDGMPTRAAESFAAKNGAELQELLKLSTAKGEYVAVRKSIAGRFALQVLPEILPDVVTGLSFPKSMYWEKSKTRFIRPIRWILALLGEGETAQVVPFDIAGVTSGNVTYGHRDAVKPLEGPPCGPDPSGGGPFAWRGLARISLGSAGADSLGGVAVPVSGFADYAAKLRGLGVEFDPEARRRRLQLALLVLPVMPQVKAIQEMGWGVHKSPEGTDLQDRLEELRARIKALPEVPDVKVIEDRELEDWVVNSTECPSALMGSFAERFLKLPREILVTVMRDHQKYFALEDRAGNLEPMFVASLNFDSDPKGLIRTGHERVLTARFSDAEFFWNADQRIPLRDRLPKLERVTYQAKLGSYGDKVRRMEAIATSICRTLAEQGRMSATETDLALRAVQLSKCDLTTQMVQEFTELQGVVGGLYAAVQDESKEVADAIYDHYKPVGLDDQLPRGIVGAIVSLVDRIDAVVGGFAAGLEPTGSSDPFGLRRQGNAIVKVLVEFSFPISLTHPVVTALNALGKDRDGLLDAIAKFFEERLRFYLETAAGCRYDTVRAVLATRGREGRASLDWNVPVWALKRARALERIRDTEDYVALAEAAKRTRNILTKSARPERYIQLDPDLLREEPEKRLYQIYQSICEQIKQGGTLWRDYDAALALIARIRPVVDEFFDRVLVMHPDPALRANRIALLTWLDWNIFSYVADLSQIEGNVDVPASRGGRLASAD
jgi:glycyl-tRNA synthetase beta chain